MSHTPLQRETASQTAGPFLHIGLAPAAIGLDVMTPIDSAQAAAQAQRIRVEGHILDGAGARVRDALIEFRHADAEGHYRAQPGTSGWGRACTDFDSGDFAFETIKPGSVAAQAPHILLWIIARGINLGLHTRMYFADDVAAHAADPVLKALPAERRVTLIAAREAAGYRFDICLQGERETVFFDV